MLLLVFVLSILGLVLGHLLQAGRKRLKASVKLWGLPVEQRRGGLVVVVLVVVVLLVAAVLVVAAVVVVMVVMLVMLVMVDDGDGDFLNFV